MRTLLSPFVLITCLTATVAKSQPPTTTLDTTEATVSVALDWSAVPDAALNRCRLRGLESTLLQALLDSGYAVVSTTSGPDIVASLSTQGMKFIVEARLSGRRVERTVPIPDACDSTIQIELERILMQSIRVVQAQEEPTGEEPTRTSQEPVSTPEDHDESRAEEASSLDSDEGVDWFAELNAGLLVPGSAALLYGPGVRSGLSIGDYELTVGAALLFSFQSGLDVFEPLATAMVARRFVLSTTVWFLVGVEAGILVHVARRSNRPIEDRDETVSHVDTRVGLPLTVRFVPIHLGFRIVPHLRVTPVRHRLGDEIQLDLERWGITFEVLSVF